MNDKEIARRIVNAYISSCSLNFEETLVEMAAVNESDIYLLAHINEMLEVLKRAKEEIEKEKNETDN